MKTFLLSVFLIITATSTLQAQTVDSLNREAVSGEAKLNHKADSIQHVDLVDYLVKWFKVKNSDKRRDNSKVRFSLFPSTSNISGGKTTFTSFNIAFLLGDITSTNISTVYFYPYISFGGQYGFQLMPNI